MMKLLSIKSVSQQTSLSIPHIRRMTKAGQFPTPYQLTKGRLAWLEGDIEQWVQTTIARNGKELANDQ